MTRTHTPDVITTNEHGLESRTVTMKRACNGCGLDVGDVTDAELDHALVGRPLPDVRGECEHCRPLVELEAQGCTTWHVTERTVGTVDRELDRLDVFAKGYFQYVDGKLTAVGHRVGSGPERVVAYWGDWLVRHPDGSFSVHTAPAAEGSAAR
ncbi:hypothetical protein [Actinacidiphila rubida]|uniref:Uncharacterized protein n=1 Tax=Actinacidiphila rubida TaxID=310780 RepID=A0A1H8SWU0_9ACTN|nr:hypothetical protein [Actinacidiphila rubida]SEO83132.1 hypothetical protein SAMN05216267_104627 [Actinacidiphila rubida]